MQTSQSIQKISTALLEIQKEVSKHPLDKTSKNPFYESKYTPLDDIQIMLHPIIHSHGIVYSQMPEGNQLTTLISHPTSGEYISSTYDLNSKEHSPQAAGSAITYAKRYVLTALFGVIIKGEDDDGNAAQGKPMSKQQPYKKAPTVVTSTQAAPAEPTSLASDNSPNSLDNPPCPNCKKDMWDNRLPEDGGKGNPKRNIKAPDFKCKDPSCGGVIWPPPKNKSQKKQTSEENYPANGDGYGPYL